MKITTLILVLTLVGLYSSVKAQQMGSPELGFRFAQDVCSECHSVSPEGSLSPNSDALSFKDIANIPGMSAQALYVWFRSPHPTMPNLALEIQDEEDVFAYILSLKDGR